MTDPDDGLDTEHDWIDPQGRAWVVSLMSQVVGDRHEVTSVTIGLPDGTDPPYALTRETLKAVPLGQMALDHRRFLLDYGDAVLATEPDADVVELIESDRVTLLGNSRGTRLTSDALAVVAEAYRSARRRGEPVVEAVATACFISRSAAAKRIRAARDAGLLEEPNR